MKHYIPHTPSDIASMLATIGVESVDALYRDVPQTAHLTRALNLPAPHAEAEILELLSALAEANQVDQSKTFLGGGAYPHLIPTIIPYLAQRGEFLTAYTPYQPELSQGTLQTIFEFQTLVCQLTGMAIANASMYDGASALAEAAIMSHRLGKGRKILVSPALHPSYVRVLRTYTTHLNLELEPLKLSDGVTDVDAVAQQVDADTSAVLIQNPNFFGLLEPLANIKKALASSKALFVCAVTEAISLGLLESPGACGADIVVGEAQSLGMPLSFGGPYAGFFAIRDDRNFLRAMPGRLCGMSQDSKGRRGFVLTLSTREQHIRREKATSNICTNQALCAMIATTYLSALGKMGLREVAEHNLQKAHQACKLLTAIPGITRPSEQPFFNEFVLRTTFSAADVLSELAKRNVYGGLALSAMGYDLPNDILVCVTELHKAKDIEFLVDSYRAALEVLNRAGQGRKS